MIKSWCIFLLQESSSTNVTSIYLQFERFFKVLWTGEFLRMALFFFKSSLTFAVQISSNQNVLLFCGTWNFQLASTFAYTGCTSPWPVTWPKIGYVPFHFINSQRGFSNRVTVTYIEEGVMLCPVECKNRHWADHWCDVLHNLVWLLNTDCVLHSLYPPWCFNI